MIGMIKRLFDIMVASLGLLVSAPVWVGIAVAIKIEAFDRQGLMRDIATVIAETHVNMSSLDVKVHEDKTAIVSATVEIDSLAQLSRLMEKIEGVRDVHTVGREAS